MLKTQANVNADYLTKLHKWLIGTGDESVIIPTLNTREQPNEYNSFVEYVLDEFVHASNTFNYYMHKYYDWVVGVDTLGKSGILDDTDDAQVPTSKAITDYIKEARYVLQRPLYSEADTPYLIGKNGKVGIRANATGTTTNVGQFSISNTNMDEHEGYWANMQALGDDGKYYSIRVSKKGGPQYKEGDDVYSLALKEDVMEIVENNTEQTDTLDIGTSGTFDATSDEQIPTSKAVSLFVKSNNTNTQGMINITYDELKALRDNAQLTPGQQYRITDYETTTRQPDTRSAGHQFDIIVVADDESTLNENARACPHYGDTYFGGGLKTVKQYTGTFKAGLTPENIIVAYTITIDMDGMYEGELKGGTDRIVELSYKDGTPIFYKNDVDYIESGEEGTDYVDEFIYNGQVEYEGETYDSWKKLEDGEDVGVTVYTNIVVENVVYTDVEVKTPQNAKLDAWELKYSLDNNIFHNNWGADFISIRTADFTEFEFQYVEISTVNDVEYTLWRSSLYHTNVFGDTYLLIKGNHNNIKEGSLVSLYVADPTGIYGDYLKEDFTVVTQVTRGKGVIYYMKDEYDNECYYDFKNIQFLRKGVDIYGDIVYTPNDVSKIIHNKHRLLIELCESVLYNYEEELTYGLTSFPIYTGIEIVNTYYDGDVEGYEDVCCTRYITVDSSTLDNADVHYLIPINEYDYKWFYTFNIHSNETFINSKDATVGESVLVIRNKISSDYKHFKITNLPNIVFIHNHITDCCIRNCYDMFFNKSVYTSNFTSSNHICTLSGLQSVDCNDSRVNIIYNNFNNVKLNCAICNFFGEITESEIGYSCRDNIIRSCTHTKIGEFCENNEIRAKFSTIGKSLHSSEIVTAGYSHIGNDNDNIYVRGSYVVVGQNNKRLYIHGNYNTIGSKNENMYLKGTANTVEDYVTDVRFVPENLTEEDSDTFNNYNCSNIIIKSHAHNLESLSSVRYSIFNNYCNNIILRINPRKDSYAVERVIIEPYAQYMTLQCASSLTRVLVKNYCNWLSHSYALINVPEKPYENDTITVITDSNVIIEEIDIQQEGE